MTTATRAPFAKCIHADSREEWLQNRRLGIGASDSAALIGEGYAGQSAATVWESKVNDNRPEFDEKMLKKLRIGQLMEPTLRAILQEETGWNVIAPPEHAIYVHPEFGWITASLDAVIDHPQHELIPGELKNVSSFLASQWEHGQIPLKFQVQNQHQMFVLGARFGVIAGLIGGNELRWQLCERNDAFIDAMMPKWAEFWRCVKANECPIDGSAGAAEVLSRLYPKDNGEVIALPPDATSWDEELQEAKEAIKAAKARELEAENQIKAVMGTASEALLPNGDRYTWKQQTRAAHEVKESTFRVLRRSTSKKGR